MINNLKIEQNESVAENATDSLINKLYSVVSGITEPLSGEEDDAQISGYLSTPHAYKEYVEYLANTVGEGTSGVVTTLRLNVGGRFPNLRIDVTNDYYILFLDSNMRQALFAQNYGDGTGITYTEAALIPFSKELFKENTSILKFNEFKYFTAANTTTNDLSDLFTRASNLSEIDLSELVKIHRSEFKSTGITIVNAPKLSTLGKDLGLDAFSSCTNLTTVQSLGTLSLIATRMFESCSNLLTVAIPETCTEILGDAFKSCSKLSTLQGIIPSNITKIGQSAFGGCFNLVLDISDYNNITKIGLNAFSGCYKVTGIINMPNYSDENFYFGSTCITKALCMGIASKVGGLGVGNDSSKAALEEAYLPYECVELTDSAFKNQSNLSILKLYDKTISAYQEGETKTYMSDLSKITKFEASCFSGCTSLILTTSDIRNVTKIGAYAFNNVAGLSGILDLPNLTELGRNAFVSTSITSVTSLGTVTDLPISIFSNCSSLTSITSSITSLGTYCFLNCTSLTTLGTTTINCLEIPQSAFENCYQLLGELNFPNVTTVAKSNYGCNFLNCRSLTKITLGHVLEVRNGSMYSSEIRGTFSGCTSLKIVDLGDSILMISEREFYQCSALKAVIIRNVTPPSLAGHTSNSLFTSGGHLYYYNWFGNDLCDVYVPDSAVDTYKAAVGFSLFLSHIKSLNDYNETTILNS